MIFNFDEIIDRSGTDCEKYDALEQIFGTSDITPLWVADMDFAPPSAVEVALAARVKHRILGYSFAPESLYEAIVAWVNQQHHWQPTRDSLMLSPGVVPGIYACLQALTNPGDGIIVMPPVYPPLFKAVEATGRTLLLNPLLRQQQQYEIDWQGLERLASTAKALLFCSPHNPVGRVWRPDELQRLLAIAERHDLILISDEIHADLCFSSHTVLASLAHSDRVITTMAPSKTFNIPGLNFAWMSVPNLAYRQRIQQVFAQLAIQVNNPLALIAAEAAYRDGAAWLDQLKAYLKQTHDDLVACFPASNAGPRALSMEGTYLLWLDCRHLGSEADVMNTLLYKAHVGLSRGSFFGADGLGYMRLNYAAPRAIVADAAKRINFAFST